MSGRACVTHMGEKHWVGQGRGKAALKRWLPLNARTGSIERCRVHWVDCHSPECSKMIWRCSGGRLGPGGSIAAVEVGGRAAPATAASAGAAAAGDATVPSGGMAGCGAAMLAAPGGAAPAGSTPAASAAASASAGLEPAGAALLATPALAPAVSAAAACAGGTADVVKVLFWGV
jgi:hypothetical protein